MKKTYITLLAVLSAAIMSAQDESTLVSWMTDALTWGQNEYYGTARSMAMGNAVTAVGGDIGMMAINPAGSAVAGYSQVSITPAISIAASNAYGTLSNDSSYLGNRVNSSKTRFIFPNGGFTIKFNTGNQWGLKRVTLGFAANTVQRWDDCVQGSGTNPTASSTLAGSLASAMTGLQEREWTDMQKVAYDAYIVDAFPDDKTKLMGVTEVPLVDGTAELAAPINQYYNYNRRGHKTDYIINLGFNISDYVFIGANLGISTMSYSTDNTFQEIAKDSDLFWTGFRSYSLGYEYNMRGTGLYGKFGVIATPVAGLRLGLAFQTPTRFSIEENFANNANSNFASSVKNSNISVRDVVYALRTPMRVNAGVAYTIGHVATISADYEYCGFNGTRFYAKVSDDRLFFDNINNQIGGRGIAGNNRLAASHTVRLGAEVWVLKALALRAGYNFISDGARFYGEDNQRFPAANTSSVSAGLGWNTKGSFYGDLAFRYTMRPMATYYVYEPYNNRGTSEATYREIPGAVLEAKRPLMTVSVTCGWRF